MSTEAKPLAFIIEDDDQLSDIFTQAMKMADFETQTCQNGKAAMEILAGIKPAVVILDLYLPGAAGDTILSYIRNDSRLKKVIVVVTTFDSLLAEDLRDKSDYVLLKPVSFNQLRDLGARLRTTVNA